MKSPDRSIWPALALLVLPGFWTVRLLIEPGRTIFLDLVNLAFHEAGHVVLIPFGSTLHYLGGTLGQLAVPALLAVYFLRVSPARQLGAALCVWWAGENLINISVYMADARDLVLPLVGGGDHDWNELFYRFGLLAEDSVRSISGGTRGAGILLMLFGLGRAVFVTLAGKTGESLLSDGTAARGVPAPR